MAGPGDERRPTVESIACWVNIALLVVVAIFGEQIARDIEQEDDIVAEVVFRMPPWTMAGMWLIVWLHLEG